MSFPDKMSKIDDVMNGSIETLTRHIFSRPPVPAYSIQFGWEDILRGCSQPVTRVFEILVKILKFGIHTLYPVDDKHINFDNITLGRANLIDQYFQSFGFTLYFQRIPKSNEPNNQITGKWPPPKLKHKNPEQELFTRILNINTDIALYKIAFDTFKPDENKIIPLPCGLSK